MNGLDELKREVFSKLIEAVGRVFVLVRHSEGVRIGRRGFLPEEKEKGLVLVFNRSMKYSWDGSGLSATLVFGVVPERCYIPFDNISAIYSPELNAQFVVGACVDERKKALRAGGKEEEAGCNLIKVDFRRAR